MAYNRFEAEEKLNKIIHEENALKYKASQQNINSGLIASPSTKEGEISHRLSQVEMKLNVLYNNIGKIKDILEPILFITPDIKRNPGEAIAPDKTRVGGRINSISCCIDEINSLATTILDGIEL